MEFTICQELTSLYCQYMVFQYGLVLVWCIIDLIIVNCSNDIARF